MENALDQRPIYLKTWKTPKIPEHDFHVRLLFGVVPKHGFQSRDNVAL
jgi:hypothetical protein